MLQQELKQLQDKGRAGGWLIRPSEVCVVVLFVFVGGGWGEGCMSGMKKAEQRGAGAVAGQQLS